jgi:hypothetical protein
MPSQNKSQEPSKPSPKDREDRSSVTRRLTPSELEALKKDMKAAHRYMKGRFKDLA